MDLLNEGCIGRLNTLAGEPARALTGGTLQVLFFDCSTLKSIS